MTKKEAIDQLLYVFNIEDFVYQIRDAASDGIYDDDFPPPKKGIASSWDHPAVRAYAKAIEVLKS